MSLATCFFLSSCLLAARLALFPYTTLFRSFDGDTLTCRSSNGQVAWRESLDPAIRLHHMSFTGDGTALHVVAEGGMIAFDARTGATLGARCAWSFGLHDREPDLDRLRGPPICE